MNNCSDYQKAYNYVKNYQKMVLVKAVVVHQEWDLLGQLDRKDLRPSRLALLRRVYPEALLLL